MTLGHRCRTTISVLEQLKQDKDRDVHTLLVAQMYVLPVLKKQEMCVNEQQSSTLLWADL